MEQFASLTPWVQPHSMGEERGLLHGQALHHGRDAQASRKGHRGPTGRSGFATAPGPALSRADLDCTAGRGAATARWARLRQHSTGQVREIPGSR
jgi:hypothetical protein